MGGSTLMQFSVAYSGWKSPERFNITIVNFITTDTAHGGVKSVSQFIATQNLECVATRRKCVANCDVVPLISNTVIQYAVWLCRQQRMSCEQWRLQSRVCRHLQWILLSMSLRLPTQYGPPHLHWCVLTVPDTHLLLSLIIYNFIYHWLPG